MYKKLFSHNPGTNDSSSCLHDFEGILPFVRAIFRDRYHTAGDGAVSQERVTSYDGAVPHRSAKFCDVGGMT